MARYRAPLIAALLALLLYSVNGRVIASGDSLPARFLPFAMLGYGTIFLDPVADATRSDLPAPYWIQPAIGGHTASLFPIATPVLVSPAYVPAVAYLSGVGWTETRLRAMGAIMEKVAASLVAAAGVGLMFALLRRSTSASDARLLTVAFAAGTSTWVISSQGLWQHAVGQLSLLASLLAVTGRPRWAPIVVVGAAVGVLAANRPLDGLFAAVVGAYAIGWIRGARQDGVRSGPRLAVLALAAAVPVILTLVYNLVAFRHAWGGYGATGHLTQGYFAYSTWEGIAGLLISPGKGLLVYSPFFFALFVMNPLRGHPHARLAAGLAVAIVIQLAIYGATDWRGGFAYGPRFLTDATPILVWLLIVPLAAMGSPGRALFVAAVACAVVVQAIGAFKYAGASDHVMYAPDQAWTFERAWRVEDSPILIEARQPFARMTLLDQLALLR